MLDVDGGADGDLILLAERLQGARAGDFHQAHQVGGGVDGRQIVVERRQRVFELDALFGDTPSADWDSLCHGRKTSPAKARLSKRLSRLPIRHGWLSGPI